MKAPIIIISSAVRRRILRRARKSRIETGGALVGYRLRSSCQEAWLVRTFIPPGPNGNGGAATFAQGGPWQAQAMAAIVRKERFPKHWLWSGGRPTYLGDWHSHPAWGATPSAGDKETAARILEEEAWLSGLLVGIAAPEGELWRLNLYVALRSHEGVLWLRPEVWRPRSSSLSAVLSEMGPAPKPERERGPGHGGLRQEIRPCQACVTD